MRSREIQGVGSGKGGVKGWGKGEEGGVGSGRESGEGGKRGEEVREGEVQKK